MTSVSAEKRSKSLIFRVLRFLLGKRECVYKIAETDEEREAVCCLIYEQYIGQGLAEENPRKIFSLIYHRLSQIKTFIAVHKVQVVATLSTIVDSPYQLQTDPVFGDVFNDLRKKGRELVECTMIAVNKKAMERGVFGLSCHHQTWLLNTQSIFGSRPIS